MIPLTPAHSSTRQLETIHHPRRNCSPNPVTYSQPSPPTTKLSVPGTSKAPPRCPGAPVGYRHEPCRPRDARGSFFSTSLLTCSTQMAPADLHWELPARIPQKRPHDALPKRKGLADFDIRRHSAAIIELWRLLWGVY